MSAVIDTPVASPSTRLIPIGMLHESPTNPRKAFDEKALGELAASITEHGLLQPILVRPFDRENLVGYEIVAGHRRKRACEIAGVTEIEAVIRTMDDHEVRRIQLVENGQRADLTPLEEADAYAELIAETGMTVREVASTVSRDPSTIAARLKLHTLCPGAKKALKVGTLPVSHAELIARIPDVDLQEQALEELLPLEWLDDTDKRIRVAVPLQKAKRILNERYTTALATAPFDPEDETLSPMGKCSTCPNRTGNNRDLFGGVVKGKNVCTNTADFQAKVLAHLARKAEQGYRVLTTKEELKEAFPAAHNPDWVNDSVYVDLEGTCYDDPKRRTFGELLGDEQKEQTVLAYQNGRVRMLYPKALVRKAVEASGHELPVQQSMQHRGGSEADRQMRAKQREDKAVRDAVNAAFAEKVRTAKLSQSAWISLLLMIVIEDKRWQLDDVLQRHGYEGTKADLQTTRNTVVAELTGAMNDAQKRAFVIDCFLASWFGPHANDSKRKIFTAAMELFDVDVKGIEKEIRKALRAKSNEREQRARAREAKTEPDDEA